MKLRNPILLTSSLLLVVGLMPAEGADSIAAAEGDIQVVPIIHGSFRLDHGERVIYVDPYSKGDYADAPKADLILVTDIHGDHLDPEMIDRLRNDTTVLVVPEAAAGQAQAEIEIVLHNGESRTVNGIEIEGVPMYNHHRGPEPGKVYHDKGRGNGYILTLGGKRIYIAGDTACTEEMRQLERIDVAFVPMNLPYTMPPEEAAECVRSFRPRIVYPYHYRGSDLSVFTAALTDVPEVEIRLREWYP